MPINRLSGQTGLIHTGGTFATFCATHLTHEAARRGMSALPNPSDPAEVAEVEPITTVFLLTDRWVIQCPACARDISFLWPAELFYMCSACWNVARAGLFLPVALPADWERVNVAAGAVDIKRRNWIPIGAGLGGSFADMPEQTVEEILAEFGG